MSYLFLADVAPLPNSSGGHAHGRKLVLALGDEVVAVCTRRRFGRLTHEEIKNGSGKSTILFGDAYWARAEGSALYLRRWLDLCALKAGWYRTYREIQQHRFDRIFAYSGADPYFMRTARHFGDKLKVPVDFYMVDDFENSSRLGRHKISTAWVRRNEGHYLRSFDRLFTISCGMKEHMLRKHRVNSFVLPPVVPHLSPCCEESHIKSGNQKIVFCGSLNHLYEDTLKEALVQIAKINQKRGTQFKLLICSQQFPQEFVNSLSDRSNIEVEVGLSDRDLAEVMLKSSAIILPYSFKDEYREMVSTSFSCKIAEAFSVGRPIIAFGPAYATIPRHFKENNLRFAATSGLEFYSALENLIAPSAEYLKGYLNVYDRWHSPLAQRKIILAGDRLS